jgi:hypothetical protein
VRLLGWAVNMGVRAAPYIARSLLRNLEPEDLPLLDAKGLPLLDADGDELLVPELLNAGGLKLFTDWLLKGKSDPAHLSRGSRLHRYGLGRPFRAEFSLIDLVADSLPTHGYAATREAAMAAFAKSWRCNACME